MDVKIEESWKWRLAAEFEKDYFKQLTDYVREEYRRGAVYPPGPYLFNAFAHCPFEQVKVVILGQDPYHEPGQAHGLCFSVQDGVPFPPSLVNIFKEIQSDLGRPVPTTGNLTRWADQGVLLLNATLTVRAHQAGSHQNRGWGNLYRCGDPPVSARTQSHRLYVVGIVCPEEGCFHRQHEELGAQVCPSFSSFCLPRFLWQQTFQPSQ